MKTKEQIIDLLKTEFPSLRVGNDQDGYVELSADEYEAQIAEWADVRLEKQNQEIEAENKAQAKTALLDRLGISEDEAQLLLA